MYGIKMRMKGALHAGEEGLGMEEASLVLHSDTLYCAIYGAWQELEPFDEDLPLGISSAYPYCRDRFFYPKPHLPIPGFDDPNTRETYAKDIKRAPFVDKVTFDRWLAGEPFDFAGLQSSLHYLEKHVTRTIRPRVTLDRVTSSSSLYYLGELFFDQEVDCGLFFLVDCSPQTWQKLQGVMKHLGENGIGGERSCGYGRFEPCFPEGWNRPGAEAGEQYVSLSLVLPARAAEAAHAVSYRLIKRGGWSQDTPHREVFMFAEGSVFSQEVRGGIVTVANVGHPVYRSGRSFLAKAR